MSEQGAQGTEKLTVTFWIASADVQKLNAFAGWKNIPRSEALRQLLQMAFDSEPYQDLEQEQEDRERWRPYFE